MPCIYTACIAAHHSPEEEDAKSHRVIQKVVKEDFQKNICVGCIHCGLCMEKCPKGAIYKEARYGLILVEKEKCAGCGVCQSVCPKGVIHFDAEGRMEKCDGCIGRLYEGRQPACVRVCCVGAIESKLPVL